eukprot:scaffold11094_cov176-Amphora_coffeaeformis.AAC.5
MSRWPKCDMFHGFGVRPSQLTRVDMGFCQPRITFGWTLWFGSSIGAGGCKCEPKHTRGKNGLWETLDGNSRDNRGHRLPK